MEKKTIFFDLDDTLYDRSVPYCEAFLSFFGGKYAEKAQQAFERTMLRGYEVFVAAHTGQMTMEAMHIYRHQIGLLDVGIRITAAQALQLQAVYAAQQQRITLSAAVRAASACARASSACCLAFAACAALPRSSFPLMISSATALLSFCCRA